MVSISIIRNQSCHILTAPFNQTKQVQNTKNNIYSGTSFYTHELISTELRGCGKPEHEEKTMVLNLRKLILSIRDVLLVMPVRVWWLCAYGYKHTRKFKRFLCGRNLFIFAISIALELFSNKLKCNFCSIDSTVITIEIISSYKVIIGILLWKAWDITL